MTFEDALAELTAIEKQVKVEDAEQDAPTRHGLYSIYVDRASRREGGTEGNKRGDRRGLQGEGDAQEGRPERPRGTPQGVGTRNCVVVETAS